MKKQVKSHKLKIKYEEGRKDTTKDYWRKEIDEKFLKQIKKDKNYLKENNGNSNKKGG